MPDVVPGAPQNESQPNVNHKHSRFPIEFDSFDTHQFGYVRPNFCVLGVPGDSLRYRPDIRSRSYTLKAPLMQDVFRRLTYVKVNLDAILPENADKIVVNPTLGDDVPIDSNTVVEGGLYFIKEAVNAALTSAFSNYNTSPSVANLVSLLKALIFAELFYSRGSLLASLGCHLYSQLECYTLGYANDDTSIDFDDFFDAVLVEVISQLSAAGNGFNVTIDGVGYYVEFAHTGDESISINGINPISFHEFICRIRDTSDWTITTVYDEGDLSAIFANCDFIWRVADDVPFNFMRCCAYQLSIAEFMTNDKIDFIYSAQLFRQHIGDLLRNVIVTLSGNSRWPYNFTYNGVYYQYDYLSGCYLKVCLGYVSLAASNLLGTASQNLALLQYFIDIFGIKRSLRYKDYFVGSRAYPLAVGDVNVNVNSNLVNVVDITRKIQLQRFLNVVNHTGRRLGNYIKTLFGVDIGPDRHVPQFLAELTEKVYTSEVENTGDAQLSNPQSITAIFTSNSSNKELDFGIDFDCCVIGLVTYDIERAYINSIDRDFFIKNRFDMFLPEMQFVGDQAVYRHELDAASLSAFGSAFGYQFRDMQWKQIFSRAAGGFVGKLPGYAFLVKPNIAVQGNISPEFIRSYPAELDNLYLSLTGYSLGNYFHFIVWTRNILDANRPMIANPTILE